MKNILFYLIVLISVSSNAQDSVKLSNSNTNPLTWRGYVEAYYSYDFNKPANNTKAAFIYDHNRHNEFNINLAFLRGTYSSDKIRGTLALATGTYMNANYAAEPSTLKNIYEANAGFRLGKKNCWIDAGIFSSHIGFESAVSKDCWTLTRSILADNSPYYEAGAKITYISNNSKWLISILALNGWQRISRVDGNSLLSIGTQVQYKPNESTTINYSTFIGTDKPDSARLIRVYHNLYETFQISKKLGMTIGFDLGTEQKYKESSKKNLVYSPVVIAKYSINGKWGLAARGEYYSDKHSVLIFTGTPNGFKTFGFSLNVDYSPEANVILRCEGKVLKSKDQIFIDDQSVKKYDIALTTSIAISF